MPSLYDMPKKEKISYPGVYDMSAQKPLDASPELSPVEVEVEPKVQMKKPVKSKSGPMSVERKTLKLGKIKG